jgi:hypothetical protein
MLRNKNYTSNHDVFLCTKRDPPTYKIFTHSPLVQSDSVKKVLYGSYVLSRQQTNLRLSPVGGKKNYLLTYSMEQSPS